MAFKNIIKLIASQVLFVFSLCSLVLVLLLDKANPFFYLPNRDSGYYLYAGRFILNNGLFYKNLWEDGRPAMYYLNALGLWLGRDSRWGVWLIELIFLTLAAWVVFRWLKKLWQPGAAIFGTLMWMWGLSHIMVTGNLIEEYPMLFGFLALTCFALSIEKPGHRIYDVLIGVFAVLSFLFRANTSGVEVAIGLTWLAWGLITRQYLEVVKHLVFIILGAMIPFIFVVIYFLYLGTLYDMFVASLLYGVFYSSEHSNLIHSISSGFGYIGIPAWIATAGWMIALATVLAGLKNRKVTPIVLLLAIIWPIEVVFSSLSARAYEHYFVSMGPAMAVTCGYIYYLASKMKAVARIAPFFNRYAVLILGGITVFILILNRVTVLEYRRPLLNLLAEETSSYEKTDRVSQYIDTFTDPKDQVLAWGGQAVINYTSHRDSPTSYPWYPVYAESPFTSKFNDQFLVDIKRQKPELIIDAYIDSIQDVPSINPETRKKQVDDGNYLLETNARTPNLPEVLAFIKANYDFETTIDQHDFYRLKGSKWKSLVPPPYSW